MNKQIIIFDEWQQQIISEFSKFKQEILSSTKVISFFRKSTDLKNIYLYGAVGRGKSIIMKHFYDSIQIDKKYIHYAELMLEIHKNLKICRSENHNNSLHSAIKNIVKKAKLLCIDEFEVKDIADAMIIDSLFMLLNKFNISIVLTTNIKPSELYKDGLQYNHFKKAIQYIEENFKILCLDSPTDYRIGLIKSQEIYITGENSRTIFQNVLSKFSNNNFFSENITVFARTITVDVCFYTRINEKQSKAAYFNFSELCSQNLGSADYLAISEQYKLMMIENIPIMNSSTLNEATRFIKLIDILYENKNILICSAAASPEKLYNDNNLFEFKRTISRLNEMQSKEYTRLL